MTDIRKKRAKNFGANNLQFPSQLRQGSRVSASSARTLLWMQRLVYVNMSTMNSVCCLMVISAIWWWNLCVSLSEWHISLMRSLMTIWPARRSGMYWKSVLLGRQTVCFSSSNSHKIVVLHIDHTMRVTWTY